MDTDKLILRKESSDANKNEERWGSLTWLADENVLNTKGITVGYVVIKKGMFNPRHNHPNCQEVLYLLNGKLEHTIGNEKIIVEEGDSILIEEGVLHNALNIGKTDAEMIVAYSTSKRQTIKE